VDITLLLEQITHTDLHPNLVRWLATYLRGQLFAQNNAFRTVTGCHAAASHDHLHQECKLIPVREHLELLSTQFLANAMQPHHPSHAIVTASPAPRPNIKPSLQTKYGAALTPYLSDGVIFPSNYKKVLSALHTSATKAAIESLQPNRVLGTRPPEISPDEEKLPRTVRTTLTQLRSGWFKDLKTYKHYIGNATDNLCPDCQRLPQSTFHLLTFPANPTVFTPWDLWKLPRETAEFLSSTQSFAHLPLLDLALPPPTPATGTSTCGP
jgi:hypothetical protein